MGKSIVELRQSLTQREFVQWLAFLKREPRGDRRLDFNIGWVVYNMRKCVGDKKSTPDDCTIDWHKDEKKKQVDPVEQNKRCANVFKGITSAFASLRKKKGN